eukprot:Gb_39241 [translate_table: standard]
MIMASGWNLGRIWNSFGNKINEDSEHGFTRADMYKKPLVGSVMLYERHVFLCYNKPDSWPPRVEAENLPSLLAAAFKSSKNEMPRKTLLTVCEGSDGTDSSNGDVLIFPDMIKYKNLAHSDVETFVEEVLIKDTKWGSGLCETLVGTHVFVCAHASRDKRCGVCGPVLIRKFTEEIEARGLKHRVFVSPCSHLGGHKYAGNLIIYGPSAGGEITGHWYGYVTPDDVPVLLDQHIGKGDIVDRLWRGQMGLMEDEQKKAQHERLNPSGETVLDNCRNEICLCSDGTTKSIQNEVAGCCQDGGENNWCQSLNTTHIGTSSNL